MNFTQTIFNPIKFKIKEYYWNKAQKEEFKFWEGISQTGYNNLTPENFISEGQKKDMLSALEFTDMPLEFWKDKTIVEFGPGPAGIIEYVDAKLKIGVEPLYYEYLKVYPHLKTSNVKYLTQAAERTEDISNNIADLVICYNMLDHVIEPNLVLQNIRRILKQDSPLLFQINVYDSQSDIDNKTGVHADLHPHSFTRESVIKILMKNGFIVTKEKLSEHKNECNERYFILLAI